jgi:hypothetical protein
LEYDTSQRPEVDRRAGLAQSPGKRLRWCRGARCPTSKWRLTKAASMDI